MREYLKKYKDLKLDRLVPYCMMVLGSHLSEERILQTIQDLLDKRYFIDESTLCHSDVLTNPVRKQIYEYIQVNPGSYNRIIRRALQIGSNEFNWHVKMLEKFGFVKRVSFPRGFGYFENRSYMGHELDLYIIQNEKTAKILHYIEQHPRSLLSGLSRDLNMHYSTIQKHVDLLVERTILTKTVEGNHQLYSINQETCLRLRKIINGAVFIEFGE